MRRIPGRSWFAVLTLASLGMLAHAAERVTFRNGFDLICDHQTQNGGAVRLYLDASGTNFLQVDAADIVSSEKVDPSPQTSPQKMPPPSAAPAWPEKLTDADLRPMLDRAGSTYDLDADLLASVIRQESGGHARAVSHAGAQGLMQLMPQTASDLGVRDSFAPRQNIDGGTAYLDALLKRYNDNLPLALAAYNAGPAAVDRWHGIPPWPETRAYVARVIHEYNRRYALRRKAELRSALTH